MPLPPVLALTTVGVNVVLSDMAAPGAPILPLLLLKVTVLASTFIPGSVMEPDPFAETVTDLVTPLDPRLPFVRAMPPLLAVVCRIIMGAITVLLMFRLALADIWKVEPASPPCKVTVPEVAVFFRYTEPVPPVKAFVIVFAENANGEVPDIPIEPVPLWRESIREPLPETTADGLLSVILPVPSAVNVICDVEALPTLAPRVMPTLPEPVPTRDTVDPVTAPLVVMLPVEVKLKEPPAEDAPSVKMPVLAILTVPLPPALAVSVVA